MRAKKIYENINFERGRDPKSAMGLGMVEIELDYHNFILDDDGNPDIEDEDTAYALKELQDSGLEYSLEKSNWGPILVRLRGYRDQLASLIASYLDEPVGEVRNAFQQWDGVDETELWNLMGY